MSGPSAPLVQVITCNSGKSLSDMKQRHQPAMEHKLDLVAADGTHGSIIFWSGENAFKAMLAAGEFQDKQRLWRRIKTDRQFDIASSPTRVAFEKSEKGLHEANAVVIASGTLQADQTPSECFASMEAPLEAMAQAFGTVSGAIGQVYLQGTQGQESQKIGMVMIFADDVAAEQYVASEAWATSQAALPWADVMVERFAVASDASAAAA